MFNTPQFKAHLVSMAQTFVALFLTALAVEITSIPTDSLLDVHTWTAAFGVGLLSAAARQAVKVIWAQVLTMFTEPIPANIIDDPNNIPG